MDKQTVIAKNLIIRTAETEPGKFVTTAVRKDSDTLVDSKMATNEQDALKDHDDMITVHALPLQARVHAAHMVKGKRYTLLAINDFGFPGALCFTFDHLGFTTYAQYDDAVTLYFTPKGKRSMRYMHLYKRPFAIYEGWRTLPDEMTYNVIRREDGVTVKSTRYGSFDDRYMQDILKEWPDYITCYHGAAKPVDTKPADEPKPVPSYRPHDIVPGIALVNDGDRGMVADMTPEMFASLYTDSTESLSAEDRLIRSLRRAAVATTAYADAEDGGTCNFDSPTLDYKAAGMAKEDVKRVLKDLGFACYEWNGSELVICGCASGQGNRRTKMAQAFCESMRKDGYASGMYYRMD